MRGAAGRSAETARPEDPAPRSVAGHGLKKSVREGGHVGFLVDRPGRVVLVRRQRSPWYTAKATPAAADMYAALRDALTQARINAISAGRSASQKTTSTMMTSKAHAA